MFKIDLHVTPCHLIIVRCPNLTLTYFDALFVLLFVTGYELTAKITPGLPDFELLC